METQNNQNVTLSFCDNCQKLVICNPCETYQEAQDCINYDNEGES